MAMAIVVGIELLALAMFLDWWLELPWALRLLSLIAQLGVFGYLFIRFVLAPIVRTTVPFELISAFSSRKPSPRSCRIA